MSVKTRPIKSTDSKNEQGYTITPVSSSFTDWKGGQAVAQRSENRRDDVLLKRPTMEMGNRTIIDYNEKKHSPPSESYVIDDSDQYERMKAHNKDNWWEYRVDSTISKDFVKDFKVHLIFAFSDDLDLNSLQKQRAFSQFMKLDLRRGTGRSEVNAFIICSLVANEDAERYGSDKLYHPQRSPEKNDRAFRRVEKSLKNRFPAVTESILTKVYNKHSQGDPPTRHPSRWKGKVKRECKIPKHPSVVTGQYNPTDQTDPDGSQGPRI